LIVGHQVTVNCLRYLLERMTEDQILDIDRADVRTARSRRICSIDPPGARETGARAVNSLRR
jgi:hypothetical protein